MELEVYRHDRVMAPRQLVWEEMDSLEQYEAAGVLRPGLDHRAVVRWITYQEFWLLTHPTVLCDSDTQLTEYIREFVIAALVLEPARPTRRRRPAKKAKA
jgi:hypothetical protein